MFLTKNEPNALPYKSLVSSTDLMLGKTDNNSRCVLVWLPAASANIDNNNFTKNGEVIVLSLLRYKTF